MPVVHAPVQPCELRPALFAQPCQLLCEPVSEQALPFPLVSFSVTRRELTVLLWKLCLTWSRVGLLSAFPSLLPKGEEWVKREWVVGPPVQALTL
jgi:hypothetical protein